MVHAPEFGGGGDVVIARSKGDEAIQIFADRGILDCFAGARNDDRR